MWTLYRDIRQLQSRFDDMSIHCSKCHAGSSDTRKEQTTCYDCLTHYCSGCNDFLHGSFVENEADEDYVNEGDEEDYPNTYMLECELCRNVACIKCATFEKCNDCRQTHTLCVGCRSSVCNCLRDRGEGYCLGCMPRCRKCSRLTCMCKSSCCTQDVTSITATNVM